MHEVLNNLYVHTQGASLSLEGDAIKASIEGQPPRRMPILRIEAIYLFGSIGVSNDLIQRCGKDGKQIAWLTRSGKYSGVFQGMLNGNVLLRLDQHRTYSDPTERLDIARMFVAGKISNCVQFTRDCVRFAGHTSIIFSPEELDALLEDVRVVSDLNTLRGIEGHAAKLHFANLRKYCSKVEFNERSRRPPLDRPNSVLSFLYTLLRLRCEGALSSVGLDQQIGFLHDVRPGRPALALDLMEEFRPLVDRLTVTLFNRGQLRENDFDHQLSGAVLLNEDGRRKVIEAWQEFLERPLKSRSLKGAYPMWLMPSLQAQLLARTIRGDLDTYIPFGTK